MTCDWFKEKKKKRKTDEQKFRKKKTKKLHGQVTSLGGIRMKYNKL